MLSAEEVNPFKQELNNVDPGTRNKVDRVLIGPVYKAKRGADFDFYRYVSFYNTESKKERIYSLPTHRSECFDISESYASFASYTYAYTFQAKITAGIEIAGIGLSTEMTESRTLTTNRNLYNSGKEVAEFTPYLNKQSWEGLTYIETLSQKTGKELFVTKRNDRNRTWLPLLFPWLAPKVYPMPFQVQDADWTFVIERTVIAKCPSRT